VLPTCCQPAADAALLSTGSRQRSEGGEANDLKVDELTPKADQGTRGCRSRRESTSRGLSRSARSRGRAEVRVKGAVKVLDWDHRMQKILDRGRQNAKDFAFETLQAPMYVCRLYHRLPCFVIVVCRPPVDPRLPLTLRQPSSPYHMNQVSVGCHSHQCGVEV
jgi:hypothetical protein